MDGKRSMALANIDLISEHHIDEVEEMVKRLKKEYPDRLLMPRIMGEKKEHWQELVHRLKKAGADMIECSFSCPQGTLGDEPGKMLGQSAKATETVARWVKEAADKTPVVIKLTPQVTDIVEIANAVKRAGCDGVCAINSVKGLIGIDINTFSPLPSVNGKGSYAGITGPAIKPVSLRCVSEIAKNVDIGISAVGGCSNWHDAIEFFLVGAGNIQIGTAIMHYGFRILWDILSGLENYLDEKGFVSISEIKGKSLPLLGTHDELNQETEPNSKINKDLCIKCDLCYIACSDGAHQAITLDENRYPVVDEDKCPGCGLCAAICPVEGCIEIK
ncbi:MAG: NAD-dependent dihydropyrimidine dehydrogenase subunit PreA, partial [bacterium]|nr:NAD-dependent dihydropyrimidine dehydrogenase subunit PreA [bacterium]